MRTPFDFEPFVAAQAPVYAQALAELQAGRKRTHWMWYVFPQLAGLGRSATAQYYGLASLDEARAYAGHPVLGARLRECAHAALASGAASADDIFGYPDNLKFHSSMTLFSLAAPGEPVFAACLDRFFGGARDQATVQLTESH
ncbi:DUF1810 domain-containing protein [Pseudoduganella sp. GCM10020061]|jgi:uncharacterized protein (DUF1810 family)|uniref:DUF1810 domain-containing protein n=1 Tax=Pseudoduganella sp. GCM10020061 TaxID=3317345 RepID=UPI00362ABF2A